MWLTTESENEAVFLLVLSPHIAWLPSVRPFDLSSLYSLVVTFLCSLSVVSLPLDMLSFCYIFYLFLPHLFLSSIKYSVLSVFLLHVFVQFNLLVTVEI